MHRLLQRQIKRYLGKLEATPENWENFINAVNDAYEQADAEHLMLEHAIELNSQELLELNAQIRDAIPDTFLRIDQQGTILDYKPGQSQTAYLPSTDILGQKLQTFLPEAVGQKFTAAIECLKNQDLTSVNIVHDLTFEGQSYFYEVRILPLLETQQVVAIVRDITERKQAEAALQKSQRMLQEKTKRLETILLDLKHTQAQLVQTEKMSGLGQLVAGIAHEVNNPVNFVSGNISHINDYICDLVELLNLYRVYYPNPVEAIAQKNHDIDLDFLLEDLEKVQTSMTVGVNRIRDIVQSLRIFSRLDEADMKKVNIHEGIESTLLILRHRLEEKEARLEIEVQKNYGDLPQVECYAGQLNQVFMNVIVNAIDAIDETESFQPDHPPKILISTTVLTNNTVAIRISNNGPNIPDSILSRLFDPFFTTKPVGNGTGLGLSISYQIIVDRHGGKMECVSPTGQDTEFYIEIPIQQP